MACDPCNDPETGALDQAEAAALDLAQGLIWTIEGRTERPGAEEPGVVLLAQGIQRALCFLKTGFGG
jgi:hypothetical protein